MTALLRVSGVVWRRERGAEYALLDADIEVTEEILVRVIGDRITIETTLAWTDCLFTCDRGTLAAILKLCEWRRTRGSFTELRPPLMPLPQSRMRPHPVPYEVRAASTARCTMRAFVA